MIIWTRLGHLATHGSNASTSISRLQVSHRLAQLAFSTELTEDLETIRYLLVVIIYTQWGIVLVLVCN